MDIADVALEVQQAVDKAWDELAKMLPNEMVPGAIGGIFIDACIKGSNRHSEGQ